MWFDRYGGEDDPAVIAQVEHLENFHRRSHGLLLGALLLGVSSFIVWALIFRIDEVASASGEVIASSRVQVIQAVDGGVLAQLNVREGDRVAPGQILARLDQTRVGATVAEVDARLSALKAKAMRLRAEVSGAESLVLPNNASKSFREAFSVERALFQQRKVGLVEDLRTLQVAVDLSRKELDIVQQLSNSGDVSESELLRAQRSLNEAEAKLSNRKNRFLEEARADLAKAEDEISQNDQVLTRRQQEKDDSVFTAQVTGIVKNIRVTTVGGVLRPGEEIMQIVPINDELIIEAKVLPADIARIHPGLSSYIRLDAFDYTIYGSVPGKVTYVSADTIKEDTSRGTEIFYRVHVSPVEVPVVTTAGRSLELLPGMMAQVDIRTGERTVMDYLLKPLRKTISDSFGER